MPPEPLLSASAYEVGVAYVKGEENEGPTGQTETYHTGPYLKNAIINIIISIVIINIIIIIITIIKIIINITIIDIIINSRCAKVVSPRPG